MKFSEYIDLQEKIKNFSSNSTDMGLKREYADIVFEHLQTSYAAIGGLKGKGFGSPEEMVEKIPLWKIVTRGGDVLAGILYKDKGGRKSVACFTNGTPAGKKELASLMKAELKVAWGEKSKGALGFMIKNVDEKTLERYVIDPAKVKDVLKKEITIPTDAWAKENMSDGDLRMWNRWPEWRHKMYVRGVGSELLLKMALGTLDKRIF